MKAVLYHEYGNFNNILNIEDCEIPKIKEDEVLVRVKAVGLNPRDINIAFGKLKFVSGKKFPKGFGSDFSGNIARIGAKVNNFKNDDSVVGYIDSLDAGAIAEYVAVKADTLSLKPANISFEAAAALPCNYLTAWEALINKAKVSKGQSIIIFGASGGVGTAAIQIAKYAGASITAVSSTKNLNYCLSQGADAAVSYDDFDSLLNSGKLFEIVFQVYSDSGLIYPKVKTLISRKGSFITLIPNPVYIFKKLYNILTRKPHFHYLLVKSDQSVLTKIIQLVQQGYLNPYISNRFSFEDFKKGAEIIASGHAVGKCIITIQDGVK